MSSAPNDVDLTGERITAWAATILAVATAVIALHTGAGLGAMLCAAVLVYILTVVTAVLKLELQVGPIISASGRGPIIAAVVLVLLFIGTGRSLLHLMGVTA